MTSCNWFKMPEKMEIEKFQESGLWPPVRLLRFWGMYLERDPSLVLKKKHVESVLLASLLSTLTYLFVLFYVAMNNDGFLEIMTYGLIATCGFLAANSVYVFAIRNAAHYSLLMRSMASAIHRIPLSEVKKRSVRSINRTLGIGMVFIAVSLTLIVSGSFIKGPFLFGTSNRNSLDSFLLYMATLANIIWMTTVGAFYILTHWMLKIVCDVIETLIDNFVIPEIVSVKDIWIEHFSNQKTTLNEPSCLVNKITFHQKISLIVIEANKVFSNFLFISLCMELMISTSMIKMMSIRNGQFSLSAQSGYILFFCFIWKALKCANINDKLKSSLTFTNVSTSPTELEQCSAARINYLVYMQERVQNRAILTYGGIFRVKKMFIFTVTGTIITYTLILNGISS